MKNILITAFLVVIASPSLATTKVFGELDVSLDNVFVVGPDHTNELELNKLLFGLKGAKEITTDVSFIYQFAWGAGSEGIDDVEDTGINNRQQVIGIASPKGAFIVGRFDTPFKTLGKKADLFGHSQLGQNRNLTNATSWDVLADKIIVFQLPRKKGLQLSAAYASDISDTSRITENGSAVSLSGSYQRNNMVFSAAYEHHNLDDFSSSRNGLRFSAIYKSGPLKLVGFMQNELNDFDETGEPDATVFGIGAAYRENKGAYKAQVYTRDPDHRSSSHLVSVGYDYQHSKLLDFYAQVAIITNQDGYEPIDSLPEDDSKGISIGLRYKFK